ncbi:unnamed protein product [Owenia fusiformis]|uniref:Uncharacterized protein n=1 Tax=Owenia fusiformis TaxID=6347 RepID=A0A8J1U688_OWEFU|nr:unnamed protein product [Owenia fusiformis]
MRFVCLFALVAMATAAPSGYSGDENNDGVPDILDANRDGKVDYGYGHGHFHGHHGHFHGHHGHFHGHHAHGYTPYGDGYPYANVGPNGAVVKSPSGLIVGDNGGYIDAQSGKVVGPNGYVAPHGHGYHH